VRARPDRWSRWLLERRDAGDERQHQVALGHVDVFRDGARRSPSRSTARRARPDLRRRQAGRLRGAAPRAEARRADLGRERFMTELGRVMREEQPVRRSAVACLAARKRG